MFWQENHDLLKSWARERGTLNAVHRQREDAHQDLRLQQAEPASAERDDARV